MKTAAPTAIASVLLAAGGHAIAEESTPAWQEPGYVMEEVVVTLPAAAVTSLDRPLVVALLFGHGARAVREIDEPVGSEPASAD